MLASYRNYIFIGLIMRNNKYLIRSGKITPKKVGQFVICWKRNTQGKTEPYSEKDNLTGMIVFVETKTNYGYFLFTTEILVKHNIFSGQHNSGKRGFRIYPPWDKVTNKQATKTQSWQLTHFTALPNKEIFDSKFNYATMYNNLDTMQS